MNIDDLSKSQLLLLTLLVNFVMSIATGIVTVSLLDVAPPTVTQTVDRIVENTVDTVAPATTATQSASASDSQPTEEDQLVSAIAGDEARAVYVYADSATSTPIAQGIYLPKSRAVVVIASSTLPQNASVGFPGGSSVEVSISHSDSQLAIYGFSDSATLPDAPATSLVPASSLKQGEAVIGITADGSAVTGIISKVDGETITTTLPLMPPGAAAVDLKDELIGISNGAGAYISADDIDQLLSAPVAPPSS